MRHNLRIALSTVVCLLVQVAYGDDAQPEDPVHNELRALRQNLVDAYNNNDIERLLSHCAPGVAVTWQNGEVSVGRDAIRAYYEKMMQGPRPIVARLTADPTVDELAVIYSGTTAVAWGQMHDHYELTSGMVFDFDSRFSATAVKEGDEWQIVSFHASPNAFDNGLLRLMRRHTILWSAAIAGAVGLLGGYVLARLRNKKQVATP